MSLPQTPTRGLASGEENQPTILKNLRSWLMEGKEDPLTPKSAPPHSPVSCQAIAGQQSGTSGAASSPRELHVPHHPGTTHHDQSSHQFASQKDAASRGFSHLHHDAAHTALHAEVSVDTSFFTRPKNIEFAKEKNRLNPTVVDSVHTVFSTKVENEDSQTTCTDDADQEIRLAEMRLQQLQARAEAKRAKKSHDELHGPIIRVTDASHTIDSKYHETSDQVLTSYGRGLDNPETMPRRDLVAKHGQPDSSEMPNTDTDVDRVPDDSRQLQQAPVEDAEPISVPTGHDMRLEIQGPPSRSPQTNNQPEVPVPVITAHDCIGQIGEASDAGTHTNLVSWSVSEVDGSQHYEAEDPFPVRDIVTYAQEQDHEHLGRWLMDPRNEPPPGSLVLQGPGNMHHSDVDTDSKQLRPKIDYPDTYKASTPGQCCDFRDVAWRHANWTSELAVIREIEVRKNLKVASNAKASNQKQKQIFEEPAWPRSECVLRPAESKDFAQISAIINAEKAQENFPQVFEAKIVSPADVHRMYEYCKSNLRPFIVAIPAEDDLTDRSKWPAHSGKAYREFMDFRRTRPAAPPTEVAGFAFVQEARVGLLNWPCPGSLGTGQIRVFVHPEHRRQKYGTALLDRILRCVTPFYKSTIDHEWMCETPSRIYEFPSARNERQYSRVYIEAAVSSKKGDEFKWRAKMLTQFEFQKAAYMKQALKKEGQSLDLAVWEREIEDASEVAVDDASYCGTVYEYK